MKIYGARYEKGELHLKCDPPDGMKFVFQFKEDGLYEILPQKKEKKRRSLDANAYAWVLIDKIAQKVGAAPMDVYRNAVRDTGGVALEAETVPLDQLEQYIVSWVGAHLGRQVKLLASYIPDCVDVIRICGSSDYDTAQMARFIDGLVQDAQALEIETRDPGWVQSLLDKWEPRP
jgi:hypothetical protein